jgi:cytochrome oxidase assembly protein ShyY1
MALHATVVVAFVATGLLGWWQLDRSRELHAASQHVVPAGAPVPIGAVLRPGDEVPPAQVGRLVTVTGRLDGAHQLLVPNRPLHGRPGYLVLAPLVTTPGTAVMVDRGWLPARPDGAAPAAPPPPQGELTLTGWLSGPDAMPPDSAAPPPEGQLAAVNAALLVNQVPYRVYDGYVHRMSPEPATARGTALTTVPRPQLRSAGTWPLQNLFYTVQWWIFGVAGVWLWVAMVRNEAAARRADPAADAVRRADPVPR